ncbi:MAG: hypothetical protein H7282_01470 [Cytophagaceae bacterium]|nr:hypothetical protein [Cytophagaceae bacterium]
MANLKSNWKQALQIPAFRIHAIAALLAGILIALSAPGFLGFIQTVQGTPLQDMLLNHIPAHDMSWYIFALLYTLIILVVVQLASQPVLLLKGLQAYILLNLMRACCIYFFPLEPDQNIIPLVDPIIDHFFYQKIVITKDLFFSGHVSVLTLLCLISPSTFTKKIAVIFTSLVAAFILVQHVHYTIDLLVGTVAAWLAHYIVYSYLASILPDPERAYTKV